jgi:hypothetical protein
VPNQILTQINGEHLPYEIDMLRACYSGWQDFVQSVPSPTTQEQQLCRNVLIESFCMHARALLDFFSKSNDPTDAIASDFTNGFVPTFDCSKEPLKTLRTKLNKELFHLTKNRTIVEANKFNMAADGKLILDAIEPAIQRFVTCLKPEFQAFRCVTGPIPFPLATTIHAPAVASATGTFQSTSSTLGGGTV